MANETPANEGRRRKRVKAQEGASEGVTAALEDMLINAHRTAVLLGELSIFKKSELGVAEWGVLKSLGDRQDVALKEISVTTGVSRQRFRKLVSELRAKGLVTYGGAQGTDKRTRTISATPLSAKVLSLVSQQMQTLFPGAESDKRRRAYAGARRSLRQASKAMRRRWLKSTTTRSEADADLDDDE